MSTLLFLILVNLYLLSVFPIGLVRIFSVKVCASLSVLGKLKQFFSTILTRKLYLSQMDIVDFPSNSVGKESACSAEDPSSIPGSGRRTGEGIGYPLHYSQASLVAQLVKNLPTVWEAWVRSLGWKDPLEKVKVTHSSILSRRIPWTMGSQRAGHD